MISLQELAKKNPDAYKKIIGIIEDGHLTWADLKNNKDKNKHVNKQNSNCSCFSCKN